MQLWSDAAALSTAERLASAVIATGKTLFSTSMGKAHIHEHMLSSQYLSHWLSCNVAQQELSGGREYEGCCWHRHLLVTRKQQCKHGMHHPHSFDDSITRLLARSLTHSLTHSLSMLLAPECNFCIVWVSGRVVLARIVKCI